MPDIRVRLFARPREICGTDALQIELDAPADVRQCFAALSARYPAMEPLRERLMVAVNEEYAGWDAPLQDGDEVAFIPPVSGGVATRGQRARG